MDVNQTDYHQVNMLLHGLFKKKKKTRINFGFQKRNLYNIIKYDICMLKLTSRCNGTHFMTIDRIIIKESFDFVCHLIWG